MDADEIDDRMERHSMCHADTMWIGYCRISTMVVLQTPERVAEQPEQ